MEKCITCEVIGDWSNLNEILVSWSQAMDFALWFSWLFHSDLFENATIAVHNNDIVVVDLAGVGTVQVPVDVEAGDARFRDDKVVNWNIGGTGT